MLRLALAFFTLLRVISWMGLASQSIASSSSEAAYWESIKFVFHADELIKASIKALLLIGGKLVSYFFALGGVWDW